MTRGGLLALAVAAAVAVAFADSSIVVLALPELYVDFHTSIVGVSLVITGYNVVVAVLGVALLPLSRRVPAPYLALAGLAVFTGASIGCGLATSIEMLIALRAVQGVGGAALLASSLPLLAALRRDQEEGVALWATASTFGAAIGPALGGALTEAFSWRAIFIAQAPVAAAAAAALLEPRVRALRPHPVFERPRHLVAPNLGLALAFAALVGALFLGVLLIVTVWQRSPLEGAGIVSVLPAAALLVRPLAERLPGRIDVTGGAVLLAAGLGALALLPASSPAYAAPALALCGAGLGLALPPLTRNAVRHGPALAWSSTLSVASRHAGLVVALALIAPLLSNQLEKGGEVATANATAAILDAPVPLTKKIPIALDLQDAFNAGVAGEIPDLHAPFEENGAGTDARVAQAEEDVLEAIRAPLTRSFRWAFALSALFALLTVAPGLLPRRRLA